MSSLEFNGFTMHALALVLCVCVCVFLSVLVGCWGGVLVYYSFPADLRWSIKAVCVEDGLDHDERLSEVLPHELVPVVGALVWAVVEHLQEWRPPQMEHELRDQNNRKKTH